jgi:hypothetical protein
VIGRAGSPAGSHRRARRGTLDEGSGHHRPEPCASERRSRPGQLKPRQSLSHLRVVWRDEVPLICHHRRIEWPGKKSARAWGFEPPPLARPATK